MKGKRITKYLLSIFMALAVILSTAGIAITPARAEETSGTKNLVTSQTTWKYLDDNTDPAGDSTQAGYDAASWTKPEFDDSAWKTGAGSFGAKNGQIKDLGGGCIPDVLLNQYIEGTTDIPAFFFRTTFQVEDPSAVTQLVGSIKYDDGAIVYVNGQQIASFDIDDTSHTNNLYYDGSNDGAPRTGEINITDQTLIAKALVKGTNTLAVELHQGRPSSSDMFMAMDFRTSTDKVTWEPDSLVVNIGGTEGSISITWFDTSAESETLTFDGKEYKSEVSAAQKSGYYSNRVTVSGLQSSTKYTYSITSAGGAKSGDHTYTTKANGNGNTFSFAAAGDPQIGASGNAVSDGEGWANTVKKIAEDGTDYSFIFSLGDQVNTRYNENEYSYFLGALNGSEEIPLLANLVGNHDQGAKNYTDHYTMPNVTKYGEVVGGDGDYSFTYNGVLFMVLNSSNLSIAEHEQFLSEAIGQHPDTQWKVVCFHKSIYSVASHVTDSDIVTLRDGLSPIFYKDDIDVVLQGHDHVYARSYIMGGTTGKEAYTAEGVQTQINNPDGVQYVTLNSASGSKFYKITKEAFTYTAVQNQEKTPNYSTVTVSTDSFKVTTHRVTDGSVVDEFTIHKCDKNHLTRVDAKDATCTAAGNTEYYKCDTCGTLYDKDGNKIDEKDTVTPATGEHTWDKGKVTKPATLTDDGEKTYTCTVCGATKTETIQHGTASIDSTTNQNGAPVTILSKGNAASDISFTEDENTRIGEGANVSMYLTVDGTTVSDVEKGLIQNAAKKNGWTPGTYTDISLYVKVGDAEARKLTKSNNLITLQITVPDSLIKDGRSYAVARVHDGTAEIIPSTYDSEKHVLTFVSDKFSAYGILYKDPANSGGNSGRNTGKSGNSSGSRPDRGNAGRGGNGSFWNPGKNTDGNSGNTGKDSGGNPGQNTSGTDNGGSPDKNGSGTAGDNSGSGNKGDTSGQNGGGTTVDNESGKNNSNGNASGPNGSGTATDNGPGKGGSGQNTSGSNGNMTGNNSASGGSGTGNTSGSNIRVAGSTSGSASNGGTTGSASGLNSGTSGSASRTGSVQTGDSSHVLFWGAAAAAAAVLLLILLRRKKHNA